MNAHGIEFAAKNIPALDTGFLPLAKFNESYLKTADKPLNIAVERNDGLISVYKTRVHGTKEMFDADCFYVERLVKLLLWVRGGYRVFVCGDSAVAGFVKAAYAKGGAREFDRDFMTRVYEKDFEVLSLPVENTPAAHEQSKPIGRHLDGCRIGFDAGGSDLKVSAVVDGEAVFSEEIIWHTKLNGDPDYHYGEIVSALKKAAEKMPRVDAIGVSSAGIFINNRAMMVSLFRKVPPALYKSRIRNIYLQAAREIGDVPVEVANDGDVTALAGAMDLDENRVLGIAMGTSEAGGYVDEHGNLTGWLNELAFVPVDASAGAPADEWSGDIGCGVQYFSQDAVIRLAPPAGIALDDNLTPAEKLKEVQRRMEAGDAAAAKIFETIGVYLGHAVALYASVYDINLVLLMGRVVSGRGGHSILDTANTVLATEYPAVFQTLRLVLPDEKSRRIGQSVAAASLPRI